MCMHAWAPVACGWLLNVINCYSYVLYQLNMVCMVCLVAAITNLIWFGRMLQFQRMCLLLLQIHHGCTPSSILDAKAWTWSALFSGNCFTATMAGGRPASMRPRPRVRFKSWSAPAFGGQGPSWIWWLRTHEQGGWKDKRMKIKG